MRSEPDRLWAPWRHTYLAKPPAKGCIFCAAKQAREARRHYLVSRGRRVFVMLNRYPYSNGHLMVAPYRHVGDLAKLTLAEHGELLETAARMATLLKRRLRPTGFNLGINVGRVAGAGIPGHLHLHVVPRWLGDVNFMPVLGQTRVIAQSLDAVFALLTKATRGAPQASLWHPLRRPAWGEHPAHPHEQAQPTGPTAKAVARRRGR